MHDWAGTGRGAARPARKAEYWKLALLAGCLLLCLVSYFVDPLALGAGDAAGARPATLGVNVPLGINLREPCKPAVAAEQDCRKGQQQQQQQQGRQGADAAGGGGGFFEMARQAGAMADERAKAANPSAAGTPCASERGRADECRSAAQSAREKIQLRCNSQMAAAWDCEHADMPGLAKTEGRCADELGRVTACAQGIFESSMRRFIGA